MMSSLGCQSPATCNKAHGTPAAAHLRHAVGFCAREHIKNAVAWAFALLIPYTAAVLICTPLTAQGPMDLLGRADRSTPDHHRALPAENDPVASFQPRAAADRGLAAFQDEIAGLVDRVSPAVVAILTDRSPTSINDNLPAADPRSWVSTGSGVVIDESGLILTSQHVLEDALAIHVTLHDGRRLRGRLVAADPRSDLAVVQVAAESLHAIEPGNADELRRGHLVFALGNPLGLAGDGQASVSIGVVSAVGRPLPGALGEAEDRYYGDMIQASVPISPGHSGGPLVDVRGRLVGVLTAVSIPPGGGEGIAFAVPVNARTRRIIDRLAAGRPIEYGYLGVEVGTRSTAIKSPGDAHALERGGAVVDFVAPGSPADDAGVREGDVVAAIDDRPLASADEFVQRIGSIPPGDSAELTLLRDGVERRARVHVARRPATKDEAAESSSVTFRGAVLGPVPGSGRRDAGLPPHALLVTIVNAETPAARAGLAPGDVVVRIDGRPLTPQRAAELPYRADECLFGLANGNSLLIPSE